MFDMNAFFGLMSERTGAAVVLMLVTVLSLFGNSLKVVILLEFSALRSLNNALFLNLAVSDLIFTLGLPVLAYGITEGVSAPLQKAAVFCLCSGFFSSTLLLMMMSFHRYLLVLHPLSDPQSHDSRHGIAVSIITWTVSISAAVPALSDRPDQVPFRLHVFLFFFFCVAVFCFSGIFWKRSCTTHQGEDRTVRVIFVIALVYALLWTPFCILSIVHAVHQIDESLIVSFQIACCHCCLKPVLYVLLYSLYYCTNSDLK